MARHEGAEMFKKQQRKMMEKKGDDGEEDAEEKRNEEEKDKEEDCEDEVVVKGTKGSDLEGKTSMRGGSAAAILSVRSIKCSTTPQLNRKRKVEKFNNNEKRKNTLLGEFSADYREDEGIPSIAPQNHHSPLRVFQVLVYCNHQERKHH
jgi:hypothetical protein